MLLGLPMVGGSVLHQTRNYMNKCIAFVDDDERFLEQSREHLTYRGYDVLGYRDSRTAFDAILRQKNRIDGICVDLKLCGSPEQGAELVWHLRMNGVNAPIFALTNNLAGETEYALLKNGADDYVTHEQLAEALEDRTATTGKIQKLVSALRSVLEGLGLTDAIR